MLASEFQDLTDLSLTTRLFTDERIPQPRVLLGLGDRSNMRLNHSDNVFIDREHIATPSDVFDKKLTYHLIA